MAIPLAEITENYEALKILKKSHLSTAIGDNAPGSIEYYLNTNVRNNLIQLGLDVFGNSYDFTNDGVASMVTPLIDSAAFLSDNETISGNWSFNGTVGFSAAVTSTNTFTSSGQPRCKAYRITTNQSIADDTFTAINFQAETYDIGSMHDTSINTDRITVQTGGSGFYLFTGQAVFDVNATGVRIIAIYKNGSLLAQSTQMSASGTKQSFLQVSVQDQSNQNDFYQLMVYQNSGGPLDVVLGEPQTFFQAGKIW